MSNSCPWCNATLPESQGEIAKCRQCRSGIFWDAGKPYRNQNDAIGRLGFFDRCLLFLVRCCNWNSNSPATVTKFLAVRRKIYFTWQKIKQIPAFLFWLLLSVFAAIVVFCSGVIAPSLFQQTVQPHIATRLNEVTVLTEAAAKELMKYKGVELDLSGLKTLDDKVAAELAKWPGLTLNINGLASIDANVAKELAAWKGTTLDLSGLKTLDDKVAAELAKWPGLTLNINGLTSIVANVAKELAAWKGTALDLSGLKTLDDKVAAELAKWPGLTLNINGLASIDANVAKELAAWKGATLDLSGLEQLSQPAAEALAEWHGELLRLTSLKSIGNDVAQELVKADAESLDLVRLVSVSEETFAILKQNPRITLPANLLPATVNPEKAMKSSAALDISSATDVPPNKRLPLPADLPETITNSIGIKMKMIPAGNFNFRLTKNSKDREIKITDPYFIGITEVTNAQWKAVMGSVPSKWKDDERPVEQVKLEDILTYCEKLSALPKERAAGRVYRFPTEAEWEFACRAGSPTLWPTTIEPSMRGDFGWFEDNSEGQTHPVGQKRANAWGLYDMRGNVSEFCSKPISQAIRANTKVQELIQSGASQLALGGNWRSTSNQRGLTIPRESPFVGFRLVLSPSGMK